LLLVVELTSERASLLALPSEPTGISRRVALSWSA
jgi:hypothetical protein